MPASVRFYRNLVNPNSGTSGGNRKHLDYLEHSRASHLYQPTIHFSKETVWFDNPSCVWNHLREQGLAKWEVHPGDVLMFSGRDWEVLSEKQRRESDVPIINVVHPRHTRIRDPRNAFLRHPAIRIAKSQAGADILEDYGVNGPLTVIPDSLDFDALPEPNEDKDLDLLIVGLKQPALAVTLQQKLRRRLPKGIKIEIQVPPRLPTRDDFYRLVNRARVVLYLPLQAKAGFEGFYLPALEGMAMGAVVVCPDCVGNRDYCRDGETAFNPAYHEKALIEAAASAVLAKPHEVQKLIHNGMAEARKHNYASERQAYLNVLHQAYDLWGSSQHFSW